jgi:SAM-dependent methyltransferase
MYQRMKREGIASWFERTRPWALDPHDQHFLEDMLTQDWAPKNGSIVEFGCGTGPMLRWICARGFEGLGVDVSQTALEMAAATPCEARIDYRCADACSPEPLSLGRHDICLDGRLTHCIVDQEKRAAFFSHARASLKPGGILAIMAMCAPIDEAELARLYPGQRLVGNLLYVPLETNLDGYTVVELDGRRYFAQSYVPHWRDLLAELEKEGFQPMLIRANQCFEGEAVSSLNVAAKLR